MTRSLRRLVRRSAAPLLLALSSLALVAARPPSGEDEVAAPRATLATSAGAAAEGSLGSNCVSNGVVEVCEEVALAVPARRVHVGPGAALEMVVAGSVVTEASAKVVPAGALGARPIPVTGARVQDGRLVDLHVPQGDWLLVVEVAFEPAAAGGGSRISGEAAYVFHAAAGLPDTAREGAAGDSLRRLLPVAWLAWLVAVGGVFVLGHRIRHTAH